MSIARIGSVAQIDLPAGGGSAVGSNNITVQSGADFLIVCGVAWNGTPGLFTNAVGYGLGAGDASPTGLIAADADNGFYYGAMLYWVAPPTGVQLFDWQFQVDIGGSNGGVWAYASYSGVHQTTPVRDSDFAQAFINSTTPITSPTLTALAGDLIVAWAGLFVNAERTITWTNATKVYDATRSSGNDGDGSLAEASPTGDQTVSYHNGVATIEDGGVSALVLRPADTTVVSGGTSLLVPRVGRSGFRTNAGRGGRGVGRRMVPLAPRRPGLQARQRMLRAHSHGRR